MANYTNFTTNTSVKGVCTREYFKVIAAGTWGSATLTYSEYTAEGDKYVNADSWTADVSKEIHCGKGTKWKLTTTGGTGINLDVIHEGIVDDRN